MTTLDDASGWRLEALSDKESHALLSRVVGVSRIDAEPEAAAELVRLCAGMPLALNISASRLKIRPAWSISRLVAKLSDSRLSELAVDDIAVRSSFMVSYRDLFHDSDGTAAARMFRLLALHNGPDVGAPIAAGLADVHDDRAEDLLDILVDAQLAESQKPGRYRTHDLLRLLSRELVEAEETAHERDEARVRMWHKYLATARASFHAYFPNRSSSTNLKIGPQDLLYPDTPMTSAQMAKAWTTDELTNITALCRNPPEGKEGVELAVALSTVIGVPIENYGDLATLARLRHIVCEHADRVNDPQLQFFAHSDLGQTLKSQGKLSRARDHLLRALDARRQSGEAPVPSFILIGLARICRRLGDLDRALDYAAQALEATRQASGNNECPALDQLGFIYEAQGRIAEAIATLTEASDIAVRTGNSLGQLTSMGNLGVVLHRAGRLTEAIDTLTSALRLCNEIGQDGTIRHAAILWSIGLALEETGETSQARNRWNRAAAILHHCKAITDTERSAIETTDHPDTPQILR